VKELPVDPERLRALFPSLTDDDLDAYAQVTRRVLADPLGKAPVMREVIATGAQARDKQAAGQPLSGPESLALRYLRAVQKMQAPLGAGRH
jgi:hypothetical protein